METSATALAALATSAASDAPLADSVAPELATAAPAPNAAAGENDAPFKTPFPVALRNANDAIRRLRSIDQNSEMEIPASALDASAASDAPPVDPVASAVATAAPAPTAAAGEGDAPFKTPLPVALRNANDAIRILRSIDYNSESIRDIATAPSAAHLSKNLLREQLDGLIASLKIAAQWKMVRESRRAHVAVVREDETDPLPVVVEDGQAQSENVAALVARRPASPSCESRHFWDKIRTATEIRNILDPKHTRKHTALFAQAKGAGFIGDGTGCWSNCFQAALLPSLALAILRPFKEDSHMRTVVIYGDILAYFETLCKDPIGEKCLRNFVSRVMNLPEEEQFSSNISRLAKDDLGVKYNARKAAEASNTPGALRSKKTQSKRFAEILAEKYLAGTVLLRIPVSHIEMDVIDETPSLPNDDGDHDQLMLAVNEEEQNELEEEDINDDEDDDEGGYPRDIAHCRSSQRARAFLLRALPQKHHHAVGKASLAVFLVPDMKTFRESDAVAMFARRAAAFGIVVVVKNIRNGIDCRTNPVSQEDLSYFFASVRVFERCQLVSTAFMTPSIKRDYGRFAKRTFREPRTVKNLVTFLEYIGLKYEPSDVLVIELILDEEEEPKQQPKKGSPTKKKTSSTKS